MPTSFINDITTYTYPVPANFNQGSLDTLSTSELKANIDKYFSVDLTSIGTFLNLRNNLLKDLNTLFGKNIQLSGDKIYDHIKFSSFVTQYADDCIEAVNAYKFYGNQIVFQINKLTDYIKKANELLDKWNNLNPHQSTDQAVSDLIHADVVELENLMKFCMEIEDTFSTRYVYDFEEDNWKVVEDDYQNSGNNNFQIKDKTDYANLAELRSTTVKPYPNKSLTLKKTLECFNEINLLDRLKYIKVYYDITENKTDYVFPEDKTYGLPCVKEEDKKKYISNIEKFYLGYLIDRDGPVNAFSGFFEMKVKAIEATIGIKQQEIKAYNAYLNFLNRGLEMLESSQSNGNNRICDGAIIALTYLCGQKMYKLFEYNNISYLVLTTLGGNHFLIENSTRGMLFLLGNTGSDNNCMGNGACGLNGKINNLWNICPYGESSSTYFDDESNPTKAYYSVATNKSSGGNTVSDVNKVEINEFTLTDELDINTIDPKSVYKYASAYDRNGWGDSDENDHVKWASVIESWTSTFQTKISHIDTSLKSTQTDIKTLQDTINTFESLTKTLRSRTHDAALNIVNKLIS